MKALAAVSIRQYEQLFAEKFLLPAKMPAASLPYSRRKETLKNASTISTPNTAKCVRVRLRQNCSM
jgi:hypothetical protein